MAPVCTTSTGRPRSPTRVVVELQAAMAAAIGSRRNSRNRRKALAALAFRSGRSRWLAGRDNLALITNAGEDHDFALAADGPCFGRTRRFLERDEFTQAGLPQKRHETAGEFRR